VASSIRFARHAVGRLAGGGPALRDLANAPRRDDPRDGAAMGLNQNYLYRVLPDLAEQGS